MATYSNKPYYDTFSEKDHYTQVLTVPGRTAQAREQTELQSILRHFMMNLGSAVLKEGAIVSGCGIRIEKTGAGTQVKVTINEGRVFIAGLVRNVDAQSVHLLGLGEEYIYLCLQTTVVTVEHDPKLYDLAQGFEAYGEIGANREKQYPTFTADPNGEGSVLLFTFRDGELYVEVADDSNFWIEDLLARRTFDESGSYRVHGLEIRDRGDFTVTHVGVAVTDGKAYVRGYEVVKSVSTNLWLRRATDFSTQLSEPHVYQALVSNYYVNYEPLKQVIKLVAVCQADDEMTSRGQIAGGMDILQQANVAKIMMIRQGSTTYQEGRDFQLLNGRIDWSPNGPGALEPSIGSTYLVTYWYYKNMALNTDYRIKTDMQGRDYLEFFHPIKPVNNSIFNIDYEYFLARRDLITIDKRGRIEVVEGQPDRIEFVSTPINQDPDKLALGYVELMPSSAKVRIVNYYNIRLTMADIYNIALRLRDSEYNTAIIDLDREAEAGEAATDLKGVFTDGFIGYTKGDIWHPEWSCEIDWMNARLMPGSHSTVSNLVINPNAPGASYGRLGDWVTAPYTTVKLFAQDKASDTMLVNPYASYNPLCSLELSPNEDLWVDETRAGITENRSASVNTVQTVETTNWNLRNSVSTSTSVSTAVQQTVAEAVIEYMREITIAVTGDAFHGSQDNIRCLFDERPVILTPIDGTGAGTMTGTVRADSGGHWRAKFTIPARVPCGKVEVKAQSSTGEGMSFYWAEGLMRTITTITTQTTTATTSGIQYRYVEPEPPRNNDPLAQTFGFKEDRCITRIGMYFAAKDLARGIVIEVRDVVNGYPGPTVFLRKNVRPVEVYTSAKGDLETLVELPRPFLCEAGRQYCFVVKSDSNVYEMFYGALRRTDLISGAPIVSNPYLDGVLFSSSNNMTWTAHQEFDLKFNLYGPQFQERGCVIFAPISVMDRNAFAMFAEWLDKSNAGVKWYYKVNALGSWQALTAADLRVLPSAGAQDLYLQCDLSATALYSPCLVASSAIAVLFKDDTAGTYVSRSVYFTEPYTNIRLMYQQAMFVGTTVDAFIQFENNGIWRPVSSLGVRSDPVPIDVNVGANLYQVEWNIEGVNAVYFKIKLVMNASNSFVRPFVRKLMCVLKY